MDIAWIAQVVARAIPKRSCSPSDLSADSLCGYPLDDRGDRLDDPSEKNVGVAWRHPEVKSVAGLAWKSPDVRW